ncbi:TPA: phage tail sheath subtilisin-like domain-containing protein [Escherichia coli]|nr:phage tail sheath subtilisin-like domain-containing protein [Escherichia coli]
MSRKSYPNVNAANQYARDVVRGKIVACQFVIQACQRHLDDLMAEKSKSFRYRFDKDLAERAAKFIQLLPHTKGEWAFKRMPITLEPWQLFVICCAFGWVNKGTRLRRFREVYTEIPRKNGKSAISAGVALYCFACDNEFGAEVYSGATTEKQAWEVFRPARLMCKRTPMLTEAFGIEVNASNMNRPEDGARFEPLIGNPGDGSSPHCAVVTEMNDTSGRWSYARQLYGHVYTAKIGTLSELVTAGDQFNQQHITLAGYEKETQTPADELAASRTARAAVFIRNDPARPTQTGELVGMLPAPKGKRFTMTEQQTLLSHGVATAYVESGVLRIQRDVTTYRKNAYGVADNSYLDSETLHTSAYVLRKLKSVITSKYGRHKLACDGTRFGPGQAIVTPAVIKGELLATYRQLERAGIVENYELFKQYLVVERDASDPNRLNTLFPPDYVNQLRVFAVVNQFRLQYSEESA